MSLDAGPSGPASHDYTEGATALDIDEAVASNKRSRRDSHYSSYFDDEEGGAMFSGPGHSVNPSSVSRMSNLELGRRGSHDWSQMRRKSHDSSGSRHWMGRRFSQDSQSSYQLSRQDEGSDNEAESTSFLGYRGKNRAKLHGKTSSQRPSAFENIANLFSRSTDPERNGNRRMSISQMSSASRVSRGSHRSRHPDEFSEQTCGLDENEEERWGYSSAEEESEVESTNDMREDVSISASMAYDSEPSSPTEPSQNLPLLTMDSVLARETRIDMDISFTLLDAPPPGPPSRQTIYIPDEDSTVRFIGYEAIRWRWCLWKLGCVLSAGLLALLGHWFLRLWLRWVAHEKAFISSDNGFIVVEVGLACLSKSYLFSHQTSQHTEQLHCFLFVFWIINITYPLHFHTMYQWANAPSCTGRVSSRGWLSIWIPAMAS